MTDWTPYLNEILGKDQSKERNEYALREELLTIASALADKRHAADDRIRLLEWIAELDDVQQVFLLPELGSQLADPSVVVRKRLLSLLQAIAGEETAIGSLLANTRAMLDAPVPTERQLYEILGIGERILLNESDIDLAMPLSTLQFLRRPALALSLLAGIGRALASAQSRQPLIDAMERFFSNSQRTPLREQLQLWLSEGPLFLRYLLVRFICDTGCSPSERRAAQALLDIYRTDRDPLVASTAVEAFAHRVELADLSGALALLQEEFATFARRPLSFEWDTSSADRATSVGIRMIGVGVLRALGILALTHLPDPRPLEGLRRILSTLLPSDHLLLDISDAKMHTEIRERIFNAAVLLHVANIRVRVTVSRESRRTMSASVGVGPPLVISDPAKLLAQHPAAAHFWAEPVPNEQFPRTPRQWTYCLRSVMGEGDRRATTLLVAMMSPVLSCFAEDPPTNFSIQLQERVHAEIDTRGWFMEAACETIAPVLEKSLELRMPLDRGALRSLFNYLADMGFGTMLARYTQRPNAIRDRLKNRLRSLFLNQLAHRRVFELLFGGHVYYFEADLLAQLSLASLRSLPGTTARRWLDDNIDSLLGIVQSRTQHIKIRVPAALALAYGSAHRPRVKKVLESLTLPCQQVYEKAPAGLRFASAEEFRALCRREVSTEIALRFAAGEDQDREGRLLFVFSEILARWLLAEEYDSVDADRSAAACLGAKTGLPAHARLRLLQAYSACTTPLVKNTLRLLHYLLRTSTGPELALYFSQRSEMTGARLTDDVWGHLISVLSEESVGHRPAGRRFDQTALADDLARRRIVLSLLAGQVRSTPDFFQRYRETRESQPHAIGTETVIAAQGQVLRTDETDSLPLELLTVVRPATSDGTTLAEEAGDIVTTFVYRPQPGTELNCLARLHPMPLGALDLHTRQVEMDVKKDLLEVRLATGRALVLARVARVLTRNEYIVDLGASAADLNRLQSIFSGRTLQEDDAVLVEVVRLPGPQLFLTDGKFILRYPSRGLTIRDLRNNDSAVAALHNLNTQFSDRRYVLRATVRQVRQHDNDRSRCELSIGFKRLMRNGEQRHPVAYVPAQNAPNEGAEVLVDPRDLRFEVRDLPQFTIRVMSCGAVDQTIVRGRLEWNRLAPHTPRCWFGRAGSLRLPIPRHLLTGDLGTLYALDALPDEHPILEELSADPLLLRVTGGGEHFSIVDVPPQWRAHDLILAVLSNVVDAITFLRSDQRLGMLIFEVHLLGEMRHGPRRLARLPLGTLVLLSDGELFDLDGDPIREEYLREGVRLSLTVVMQQARLDGTLGIDDVSSPLKGMTPYLCIAAEPDETNIEFASAFENEKPLRVRIVRKHPELELDLAEEIPPGYPAPYIGYVNDNDFTGAVDTELDVVIAHSTAPTADEFIITVAPPRTVQVWLNHRNIAHEVRLLFDLHANTFLEGRKRLHFDDRCFVRNLKVEWDPSMRLLLPRLFDLRELVSTFATSILLTKIDSWRSVRSELSTEVIPFLDKHEQVVGVVIGVPQGQGLRRVEVRWLDGEPEPHDPDPAVSDSWQFDPGQQRYYNGDIIRVRRARGINDRPVVWHEQRTLHGTLVHEVLTLATWTAMYGQGRITRRICGTFIRGKLPEDERFLFVLEPACLVGVPTLALIGAACLDDMWPLDSVELTLSWTGADGDRTPVITIEKTEKGFLRSLVDQRCTLEVRWHDFQTDTYSCRFAAGGLGGGFELPVVLPAAALSQPQRRAVANARPTPRKPVALDCLFGGYVLNVRRIPRADKRESLRLLFEPQFVNRAAGTLNSKVPLDAALDAAGGRLDDASGNVAQLGQGKEGELVLGVELDSYQHPEPIPLPDEEQTWINHTGHYAKPGWSGKFAVVRDSEGRPFASLRRRRPMSLESWIEQTRLGHSGGLIDGYRLLFLGVLSDSQLSDCGLLESNADEDIDNNTAKGDSTKAPLVLFEVALGAAFTATLDQLRLFGEPFDRHALHPGDVIDRFRLLQLDEEAKRGLDLQHVVPDVRVEIESFGGKRGILFGSVRLNEEKGEIEIADLRGLSYSPDSVSRQRRGRWKLCLEPLEREQQGWLDRLSDDEYVYFKFTRAEPKKGELYFRLLNPDEVFERANLVYVQADRVTPYGSRDLKLDVRPLNRLGSSGGRYFIPDTLYSERRGWLNVSSRTQSGIFLARVLERQMGAKAPEVKLSLRHNPFRRFESMLHRGTGQAIVKHPERGQRRPWQRTDEIPQDYLLLEVSEGVNVKAPRACIDWLNTDWQDAQPGDIIFFKPLLDRSRIIVTDVLRSHGTYFEGDAPALILTMLWSRPSARREAFVRGGPETTVNCSLVGLPQLKGVCRPADENLESTTPLPQVVIKPLQDEWVRLEDRQDARTIAGLLTVNDEFRPEVCAGEERLALEWSAVTFLEATFEDLASHLKLLTFRNLAAIAVADSKDTLASTPVLARRDAQGSLSLVAMARWPLPVEHLIEQFPPRRAIRAKADQALQKFVVAKSDPEYLILEVIPGRFAILPSNLISPTHHSKMQKGLQLDLTRLHPGDIVALELVVPSTGTEEFIPRFRLHSVIFGNRRHFDTAFTVPVRWDDYGSPLVGTHNGSLFSMPIFDEHFVDLHQVDINERYALLKDSFSIYGQRLVLIGRAEQSIHTDRGMRCFIDIGINVPVRIGDRRRLGQPSRILSPGEAVPMRGSVCHVRVLEATFDTAELNTFLYETNMRRSNRMRIVNSGLNGIRQSHELPRSGDAVLIHLAPDYDCRIAGVPTYNIIWTRDDTDALRLHDPEQRRLVLRRLLDSPEVSLWSTVETIDHEQRIIFLSRRLQTARSLPEPGHVVPARVIGALSSFRLLVDLCGLPWTLSLDELSYGSPYLKELCAQDEKDGGLCGATVEVVRKPDGRFSALAVYEELPTRGELEAIVTNCTPSGILVINQGRRMFVPKSELAWCDLDACQIARFFPPGERISISVTRDEVPMFSHIRTHPIRTEFSLLLRNSGDPVYVRCVHIDQENRRAIVRGRSKVLMELMFHEGEPIEERICGYVLRIDSRRHRVVLSLDETPPRLWNFAPVKMSEGFESAPFAVDALSAEVIKSSLEDLQRTYDNGGAAISTWAARQRRLEPSPRNLRLTVEQLTSRFGSSTVWANGEERLGAVVADPTPFQVIWSQVTGLLTGHMEVAGATPIACFAAGYSCLLEGRVREADSYLRAAWADRMLQHHFEVELSVARVALLSGDRRTANSLVRSLTQKFFSGSLRTFTPPLLEPEPLEAFDTDHATFAAALAGGDLDTLERLLIGKFGLRNPSAARTRSNAVWFLIARSNFGPDFDHTVRTFFDALREEESIGLPVDARLHVMAAFLSFARGNVIDGWWYLDRLTPSSDPELQVAFFWRAFLLNDAWTSSGPDATACDRLLSALWNIWRQSRWREDVDRPSFDELWEAFRKAPVRWIFDGPGCRVLPDPPTQYDELLRWATEHGAEAALRPLLAERGLIEPVDE